MAEALDRPTLRPPTPAVPDVALQGQRISGTDSDPGVCPSIPCRLDTTPDTGGVPWGLWTARRNLAATHALADEIEQGKARRHNPRHRPHLARRAAGGAR